MKTLNTQFDYVGARTYTDWYPNLFYQPGRDYVPPTFNSNRDSGDEKGSDSWDLLVSVKRSVAKFRRVVCG